MNGSGDKGSNKSELSRGGLSDKSTFSHLEDSLDVGRKLISDALSSVDNLIGEMNSLNGQKKRETEEDTADKIGGPPMLDKANNGIEGTIYLNMRRICKP